jgi:hypothetical protein
MQLRLLSGGSLQAPLPLCLTTSAFGRQHGCCSCMAKLLLSSRRVAASSAAAITLPRPLSLPRPPARVPEAGGLVATWGRASTARALLPVQRQPSGRRQLFCPRPLRHGDRAPGRLKGCILCRCAKPGSAPPWPQCSWRTISWYLPVVAAGAAAARRQPLLLLLPELPWRRQLRRRLVLATG